MVYIGCCNYGSSMASPDSSLSFVIGEISGTLSSVHSRSERRGHLESAISSLISAAESLEPNPTQLGPADLEVFDTHIGLANLALLAHITDVLTPE